MSYIYIDYEHTDTFGGEANYSWVNRGRFEVKDSTSDLAIVRQVKKILGLTGIKCSREVRGETIVLRPYGFCSVVFIDMEGE